MPSGLVKFAERFVTEPSCIFVNRDKLTLDGIEQFYIFVETEEAKLDTLCDIYEIITVTQIIVFCNTGRKVDWLANNMNAVKLPVSALVR